MICADCFVLNELLDTLNFGVFVLDAQRKPVFANARALEFSGEGQPFQIDGQGALRAVDGPADKQLCRSIEALRLGRHKGQVRPIAMNSGQCRSGIFAWVSLLGFAQDHAQTGTTNVLTSLMVTEKARKEIGLDVLAELFDLTAAESRLLTCVLQGLSPNQYAAQKNLSRHTVRNQLKGIFEKTQVRRQSDLVNLVSTVLAPVKFE